MSAPRASETSSSAGRLRLRIATYNVHSCVGVDGQCDPKRVAEVIQELRADVVALQEMTYPADLAIETRTPFVLPALAEYECALGPTHVRRQHHFGNVLLSRFPIRELSRLDLSAHRRREPRGALHVVLDAHGAEFHVFATHLGLGWGERRVQVERLVKAVQQLSGGFLAVVGDFNDWLPGRSLVHVLDQRFGSVHAPKSFPARWPLVALDRVWVQRARVVSVEAHASALAKRASDHLPIVAELEIESR